MRPVGLCQWADVSSYLRAVRTNRGRQTELSSIAPGTMSVTVSNGGRVFDPSNTAGPYYGKLTPMRRIRLSVVIGTTVLPLFTGYVLGWPISYIDRGADSTVTVQCVDGFRTLSLAACPGSAYGAAVLADSPSYYWPLQSIDDTGGSNAVSGNLDLVAKQGTSTVATVGYPISQASGLVGSSPATLTTVVADPPSITFPSTIEMWVGPGVDAVRLANVLASQTTTDAISIKPGSTYIELRYSHNGYRDSTGSGVVIDLPVASGAAYHLVVTVDGTTASVYCNGVLAGTSTLVAGSWAAGNGAYLYHGLGDTKTIGHIAEYPSVLSSTQILAHYFAGLTAYGHPWGERAGGRIGRILDSVGHPAVDRNLTTGETVLGQWTPDTSSALNEIRAVEDAEQGLFFISAGGVATFRDRQYTYTGSRAITAQATFGDQAGEIGYSDIVIGNDIDYVRNVVTVTYPNGSITVTDQPSVDDTCGAQTDSITATELPTWGGWLARQLAAFRLALRRTPLSRVPQLTVKPLTDLTNYALPVCQLELGDRVRVLRRPTGGSGNYDQYCQVQGVGHNMDAAGNWTATLYLAPCPPSYTEGRLLTVADATYGVIGESAAPNLVPY